jgi:hypothetical protein
MVKRIAAADDLLAQAETKGYQRGKHKEPIKGED